MIVLGSMQDRPRLTDVDATTPLWLSLALKTSPTAYALPSGPKEFQGSETRSNSDTTRWNGFAQRLKGSVVWAQDRPPSNDRPADRTLAPPLVQRSCCQVETRFRGSRGVTASHGSTSALGKVRAGVAL